jgi:hypothetical protein
MNVQADAALGTGPVTLNAPATLFLERVNATNPLTLNGGTIIASNGFGDSWNGPVTLNANTTINAQYNMSFGGAHQRGRRFHQNRRQPVEPHRTNSFTGALTVQAGTLAAVVAQPGERRHRRQQPRRADHRDQRHAFPGRHHQRRHPALFRPR